MDPIARLTQRTGGDAIREAQYPNIRLEATNHINFIPEDDSYFQRSSAGMFSFLDIVSNVAQLTVHHDDDFFDRLSHRYTIGVLVIAMIIVGSKQYVGDPINCWCPAHFVVNHEEYANNVCWVSNTYYVPPTEGVPESLTPRKEKEVAYYQWVPFILACMAAFYFFPHVLWRIFCSRVGLNINGIVKCVNHSEHLNPEIRDKTLKFVVRHMDRYLDFQRERGTDCCSRFKQILSDKLCLACGKKFGNNLIAVYLCIKVLYIGNAIGQMFLLNKFLATDYLFFGFEVVQKLVNGSDWKESHRFPRVTLCDFEIRRLGGMENMHRYTLQCALPINLFNEKIFIFLWFWLAIVAVLSFWGILSWIRGLFSRSRYRYIKKYLVMLNFYKSGNDSKLLKVFTERYLRQDGIFVLKLISINTNDIVIAELIGHLWDNFKRFRTSYHPKPTATV